MTPRPRNSHLLSQVQLGDEIEVWWPHDATYYSGIVGCKLPSGRHRILYHDGEVEDLRLATEQWRFIGTAAQRVLASGSTPPPLDAASPEGNPDNFLLEVNPPPQGSRLSESTSASKTASVKKRGKSKSRKSDSSKTPTLNASLAKKPSSAAHGKTTERSKLLHASSTPPAPQVTTTNVKKRQRSSSTTTLAEKTKPRKSTVTSQDLPSLDVDSGLIDAAPLNTTASNNASASKLAATTPRPSTVPLTRATAPSVNSSEKSDALQRKTSTNLRGLAPLAPANPRQSVTKPLTMEASSVRQDTPSTIANGDCPPSTLASDIPAVQSHASVQSRTPRQSNRKHTSSTSFTSDGNSNRKKVASPCTNRQQSEAEEREKPEAESVRTKDTPMKENSPTPLLDTEELRGPGPNESHHMQTPVSQPLRPTQSVTPNPNSLNSSLKATSLSTKGHGTPNDASQKTTTGLGVGDKDKKTTSSKTRKRSNEKQNAEVSCDVRAKFPNASDEDLVKRNEPGEAQSPKNLSKSPPQATQGGRAESSPTAKGTASECRPLVALLASCTDHLEQRRRASGTIGRSTSSRPGASRSVVSPVNSRGTGTPSTDPDSSAKRGSRPNSDTKSTSKSKGGSVAKSTVVKRSVAKPAKFVLQRQTIASLSSRRQSDSNGCGKAVNPDDGSDIIADVSVPRKAKGGVASPLLRSPLSGIRLPLPSSSITGALSPVIGPKAMNGADLKKFSLRRPITAVASQRDDRSPLLKGERSASKPGPFQPTRRRSDTRRQVTVFHEDQRSLVDSHSRNARTKVPLNGPTRDREQKSDPQAKPSRSYTQHEALAHPALQQKVPAGTNHVIRKPAQRSDSRPTLPNSRQASFSEVQTESNSMALKKSVSALPGQEKSSMQQQSAVQKSYEIVDRSKASVATVENLVANSALTKGNVNGTPRDVPQPKRTASRVDHGQGSVVGKGDVSMEASKSPTAPLKARVNAEIEPIVNGGMKRTASEHVAEGKRRKLNSSKTHDLQQASKTTPFATSSENPLHVPKTMPQRSSSSHQQSMVKELDGSTHKQSSNLSKRKTLEEGNDEPRTVLAQQPPFGITKGEKGEDKREERTEKLEGPSMSAVGRHQRADSALTPTRSCERDDPTVGAEVRSSDKTQSEPVDGRGTMDAEVPRIVESVPSAVTAARAAVSTAALQSPQSSFAREGSSDRGVTIARFAASPCTANRPCGEIITGTPTSANRNSPLKEATGHRGRTEEEHFQKSPDPPCTRAAPTVSHQPQPPGAKDSRPGPHESQPSPVAPRSFARVRPRHGTGSVPDKGNSKSTASLTQDLNKGTASLPLDVLMRTIAEANKKSLQSRLAPLSSRLEKFFADNDMLLRSLQGQIDKATKTVESLREDLGEVRNAVSDVPSMAEVKTFLESHAQKTKRDMTDEMKIVTSKVKEDLRDYLKSELEDAMKNVAAQIQRDSVNLISKAIDNAMNSGLLQEHPQIADEKVGYKHESREPIRTGGKKANSVANLAKVVGMDCDKIPVAHRFCRRGSAGKRKFSKLSDSALAGLLTAATEAQLGEPAEKEASSSAGPLSPVVNNESEARILSSIKCRGGVNGSSAQHQPSGLASARVVYGGTASPRSDEGDNDNGNLVGKETPSVTPAMTQNSQSVRAQSKVQCAPLSPAAHAPGPETSFPQKTTAESLRAQDSGGAGHSQDKEMKLCQAESPELGCTEVESAAKNPSGPRASMLPSPSPNASKARLETPLSNRKHKSASVVDEKGQENTKLNKDARPARRESYRQLTCLVRMLLARCIVEWFLSGGCRDIAPPNERTTSVSDMWVKESVLKCLDGIISRLEVEDTFAGAMRDLTDSVGPEIETDWLLQGPTVANINKARANYKEWDPQLYDFEWESEKRVLSVLSEELISAEESLVEAGEIFEDPLYTALCCLKHASKRNAAQLTK